MTPLPSSTSSQTQRLPQVMHVYWMQPSRQVPVDEVLRRERVRKKVNHFWDVLQVAEARKEDQRR